MKQPDILDYLVMPMYDKYAKTVKMCVAYFLYKNHCEEAVSSALMISRFAVRSFSKVFKLRLDKNEEMALEVFEKLSKHKFDITYTEIDNIYEHSSMKKVRIWYRLMIGNKKYKMSDWRIDRVEKMNINF